MSQVAGRRWPLAVLFDLDGTLIDSAPDIRGAVNELLERHALGPLSLDAVKSMIGQGVKVLVERAFRACGRPLEGEALENVHLEMLDIYGNHLTRQTVLMPAALETLEALHGEGVRLAVATNKPQRAAEAVLDHFGFFPYLGSVVGGDAGVAKKPAPDILLAALDRLGVGPADALMVGDSHSDVASARAAGMTVVVVRGGYTAVPADELGADRVLETLGQLPEAFETLRGPPG
ncbi:MAG: phosphoglycolate phosphatase [Rhizobiales bacterium]|nr:phosphoglycolate phosphatase [Hyphomicrobiales bacterium]